jgi:hypothetical protein
LWSPSPTSFDEAEEEKKENPDILSLTRDDYFIIFYIFYQMIYVSDFGENI